MDKVKLKQKIARQKKYFLYLQSMRKAGEQPLAFHRWARVKGMIQG